MDKCLRACLPRRVSATAYTKNGVSHKTAKWYVRILDLSRRPKRIPLTRDRRASQRAANALEDAIATVRAGGLVNHKDLAPLVRDSFLRLLEDGGHPMGQARVGMGPISKHIDSYQAHLEAAGRSERHILNTRRECDAVVLACGFSCLDDVTPEAVERFLLKIKRKDASARTRNGYLGSMRAFLNWCTKNPPRPKMPRLSSNPLAGIVRANEAADRKRERRAFTPEELQTLLDVARRRPLEGALRISRGKRSGEFVAKLSDSYRARLERTGRERALIYKTLALTGLRVGAMLLT